MKRGIALLMALLLLAPAALAQEDARDASGVVLADGRLTGAVTGLNKETGRQEQALWVDCPEPAAFAKEQLALLTTKWLEPDAALIGSAVRATGAAWRDGALELFTPYSFAGEARALDSSADPDEARARAPGIAQDFARAIGAGDTLVVSALHPEDEARAQSLNEPPETREAFIRRTLKEWYTPRLDSTWVQLTYTLRGLPAVGTWERRDEQGDLCAYSSAANFYIGDAGEMRGFILFYAPREVSAAPYGGPLKTWREALTELAGRYGCADPAPTTDERGRVIPAHRFTVTGVSPCFQTDDGALYHPGWLFTVAWEEENGPRAQAVLHSIDARAAR